tara:strand:+ start:288 stop:428 length:141 start_codon:yes stop_codon:yes gene_type:complete
MVYQVILIIPQHIKLVAAVLVLLMGVQQVLVELVVEVKEVIVLVLL